MHWTTFSGRSLFCGKTHEWEQDPGRSSSQWPDKGCMDRNKGINRHRFYDWQHRTRKWVLEYHSDLKGWGTAEGSQRYDGAVEIEWAGVSDEWQLQESKWMETNVCVDFQHSCSDRNSCSIRKGMRIFQKTGTIPWTERVSRRQSLFWKTEFTHGNTIWAVVSQNSVFFHAGKVSVNR